MKHIVLFASGSGSNAEKIIKHFQKSSFGKVVAVFSNKAEAGVLEKSKKYEIPTIVFLKEDLSERKVLDELKIFQPDLIVLAGFLLKFPQNIIQNYPGKIVNIHPALLPKYGGKGMYGMNVHRAVLENQESETGITIHYIDEHYDKGDIIFQKSVSLNGNETCEEIADKVQKLEHEYFPQIIERLLTENL